MEFLVTSDLTLQELDGIWFGDSKSNTNSVDTEYNFNSAEIISNSSYFHSTANVLKAGTFLTVGGGLKWLRISSTTPAVQIPVTPIVGTSHWETEPVSDRGEGALPSSISIITVM